MDPQGRNSDVIKCCDKQRCPPTRFLAVLCLLQEQNSTAPKEKSCFKMRVHARGHTHTHTHTGWGRYARAFHAKSVCMARRKPRKSSQRLYSLLLVHPHAVTQTGTLIQNRTFLASKLQRLRCPRSRDCKH